MVLNIRGLNLSMDSGFFLSVFFFACKGQILCHDLWTIIKNVGGQQVSLENEQYCIMGGDAEDRFDQNLLSLC